MRAAMDGRDLARALRWARDMSAGRKINVKFAGKTGKVSIVRENRFLNNVFPIYKEFPLLVPAQGLLSFDMHSGDVQKFARWLADNHAYVIRSAELPLKIGLDASGLYAQVGYRNPVYAL